VSSLYVRNMVRGWAAASPTPFYDTINLEQKPADAVWFTAEFEVESSETLTICEAQQEEGVIELVFCGLPGTGDAAVLTAAEAEGRRLLALKDPQGKLMLKRAMPPEEFSAGDADPLYRAVVGIEYAYYA